MDKTFFDFVNKINDFDLSKLNRAELGILFINVVSLVLKIYTVNNEVLNNALQNDNFKNQ